MLVYSITFYSLIAKNKKIDFFAMIAIYMFALFFLGLRDQNSGVDTSAYVNSFNNILHVNNQSDYEPAFYVFTTLSAYLMNSEFFIFINVFFQLAIVTLSLFLFNIQNKSLVLLSYISIYAGFDLMTNGLRQGLTIAFATLIYAMAYYKNYLPKLTIFVLIFFHKSALAFIPIYFLNKIKSTKVVLNMIKVIFSVLIIILIVWHLFESKFDISNYVDYLSFTLPGTGVSFGNKLNMYLLIENEVMLSGIFKYYFLSFIILFLSIFLYFHQILLTMKTNARIIKFALLVFMLSLEYAVAWPSSYSYRFMYTAFLPGLILMFLILNRINKPKYSMYFMVFILICAILTYGSNTYQTFNINI